MTLDSGLRHQPAPAGEGVIDKEKKEDVQLPQFQLFSASGSNPKIFFTQ